MGGEVVLLGSLCTLTVVGSYSPFLSVISHSELAVMHGWGGELCIGLVYQGKDIVFRFIIEYIVA
jgi:hypothetical protein